MASPSQAQSGQKKKRRPNLSMAEEVALCQAYVKITTDGKVGNNQTSAALWDRIEGFYATMDGVNLDPENPTKGTTLQKKFSTISTIVGLYVACLTSVEHASGLSPADWVQNARRKFRDNNGKEFGFDHCFEVLRVLDKYNPDLTRRQSELTGDGSSAERPPGRKGEKERQRTNNSRRRVQEAEATIESTNEFLRWNKEAHIEKERRKLQFQQDWLNQKRYDSDTQILYMNTTHFTPTQLAMHNLEVEQINARRNAAAASPPPMYYSQPQGYSQQQGYSQPQDATPLRQSGHLLCASLGINGDDDEVEEDDESEDEMYYG